MPDTLLYIITFWLLGHICNLKIRNWSTLLRNKPCAVLTSLTCEPKEEHARTMQTKDIMDTESEAAS
jgi:hypothetical protein